MLGRFLERLHRGKSAPLTGAPSVRRQKTYSAQSGYVYQYVYEGHRKRAGDAEYVFNVTSDRKTFFPVPVVLPDDAVETWERAHDFKLRDNERHGIVKLALCQAFDERVDPGQMHTPVMIRLADLEAIVETLRII